MYNDSNKKGYIDYQKTEEKLLMLYEWYINGLHAMEANYNTTNIQKDLLDIPVEAVRKLKASNKSLRELERTIGISRQTIKNIYDSDKPKASLKVYKSIMKYYKEVNNAND